MLKNKIRDKALYRGLSLGLVMEVIIHNLGALDLDDIVMICLG
jgi:hypothetical protein